MNGVFLLPPWETFDAILPSLALAEGTSACQVIWKFSTQTLEAHAVHNGWVMSNFAPLGEVVIVAVCLVGADLRSNLLDNQVCIDQRQSM